MDTPAKRKPGWPKTTWRRTVKIELGEVKHTWFEALHIAIKRYKCSGIVVFLQSYPIRDEEDELIYTDWGPNNRCICVCRHDGNKAAFSTFSGVMTRTECYCW